MTIIEPFNLRANFSSDEDFIAWLETGTIKDLECTLHAFCEEEMYEDCIIIKNTLVKMQGAKDAINNTDTN